VIFYVEMEEAKKGSKEDELERKSDMKLGLLP
jgi:hypothetical protein